MIELEQTIEDTGVRFDIKGERQEIDHIVTWLGFYGQAHKFWAISDRKDDPHSTMTAFVFLDEDVDTKFNRIDFAALFKLTFCKFEINLPDAENTNSELFSRLNALVEATSNLPENKEAGLDRDTLGDLKKELGL